MKFYVTTPIYYVNDRPHIGHVYTTTIADIVARFHRLCGDEVFFLTGTDEHAAKVVESAAEHGVTPQQWAEQNAEAFRDAFSRLGISNDDFVRTTQSRHKAKVQQYAAELLKSGDVYLGEYEGWYDAGQEEYVPENKAKEYEYKSPINGKPLVRKREKNYFFRLSRYGDALLKLLEERPEFVRPDVRRNEVLNRIREGLNDVPISRAGASQWGIRVPGDPEHTIYVWIDALFNYLSTVDTDERWKFWPADVHLIAKDILWFHAVIWPAMLIALKRELPRQVYAHSFWISEGQKMSKSLGNFIDLEKIDRYVASYGLDAFRYFLARYGPLGVNDSDFAEARFIEVYNAELADDLGNLVNRTLSMVQRYRQGRIPKPGPKISTQEEMVSVSFHLHRSGYLKNMGEVDLASALANVMEVVSDANRYVEQRAPWLLAKSSQNDQLLDLALYNLAEIVRLVSVMIAPFMPTSADRIREQLGVSLTVGTLADELVWARLAENTMVGKATPLFPKRT
jgi:methionyl-tRNA synthetase